jgi:hypothetical protein
MARKPDLKSHRHYGPLREYKATMVTPSRLAGWSAHSAGIGRKEVNGKRTGTLALLVYVARKRPKSELSSALVPETVGFFSRKQKRELRLPTDVIEMPQPEFEVDPESRIRPVPGGVSFGTMAASGTLGGWVWDTTDDSIVALTNHHVLFHTPGVDIAQQSPADGGSLPADKIGDVKRAIQRSSMSVNTVDCAIGDADSSGIPDLQVLEVGPAVFAVDTPVLDLQVEKFGQTTQHTFGEITDVDYETTTTSGFSFDDCIRIAPIDPSDDWSDGGDSGSVVFGQNPVSGDNKPAVGLHFAGGGVYGVACKIQNVFAALDLTTVCAGLFASFLDSLFESEEEGEVSALRPGLPLPPTPRERRRADARRLRRGMARELQARLVTTRRGRVIDGFVDTHRAELATLLLRDGDMRRATVAALGPLVAGAVTTTDVLDRMLTAEDVERLETLGNELSRRGSEEIRASVKPLLRLSSRAEGKTPGQILRITL